MTRRTLLFLFLLPAVLMAQDDHAPKFGITFSGYVKSDFMVDSRQTFAPREGHFMLWPMPKQLDENGVDINEGYNTNFLPIQSQLSGKITGPDALGAKTSGVLEGDFFGTANANINLLRLRHAFIKLSWSHTELLMGQYWHPMFNLACFPSTVSFNTGSPINPFSRDPQIRITHTRGKARLMLAAVEQRDYPSYGPSGASSSYLRNAVIPELFGEISYQGRFLTTGISGGTKTIVPRLSSTKNGKLYKVDEKVTSKSIGAFLRLTTKPVTLKVTAIYGENLSDVMSITGFAVTGVTDTLTGAQSYAPMGSRILWADFHTNGKTWQAGIFGGITENTGTTKKMEDPKAPVYGLTTSVIMVYRVSPRLVYQSGKTRFAAEVEFTNAEYGVENANAMIDRDLHGLPLKTAQVANTRFLVTAWYFF